MQSDEGFQWPRPTFLSKDLSGGRIVIPMKVSRLRPTFLFKKDHFYQWPGLYPDEGFVAKAHLPYE